MKISRFLFLIMFLICFSFALSCSSESKTLKVSPSKIDFKEVYIDEQQDIEVTLTNKYGKELTISTLNIDGASEFFISSSVSIPITLQANEEYKVTLSFIPISVNKVEALLSIEHSASDNEKNIKISGVGVVCARIALSDQSYDFLKRSINRPYTHDVEIENIGTDDLNITGLNFSGSGASEYKVTAPPLTILPGTKQTITITFEPTSVGQFDAVLTIEHNAVNEDAQLTYSVKGEGRNDDPQITLNQTSPWDFGKVVYNKPSVRVCEIENTGLDPLRITSVVMQTSTEFVIDSIEDTNGNPVNLPYDIAVGDKILVSVKFTPSAINTFNDVLEVKHNATNEISPLNIAVSGEGIKSGFDFNGDGYTDVLSGAFTDDDGGSDSGCVFIFFGSATPSATIDASAADVKLVGGDPNDRFGRHVASAGDFNNDGYDDVIVGAYLDDNGGADSGCAFIFYGSATPLSVIDASVANVTCIGGDPDDYFGVNVSSAGDFNNDGFGDVIVGAQNDDDGGSDSGCAFVFFGSATPPATIAATAANVKLIGGDPDDKFGSSVSYGGDFNSDGISDVIVGAYADDDGGTDSGCAFVFFGSATPSATIDASAADVKFVGADPDDSFSIGVSTAGDFNNDGIDDILIGAYYDDDGATNSGCAFIFYGSTTPAAIIDASAADVKFVGSSTDDRFGIGVCSAGDFNNDGFADVIVGADYDDDGGAQAGCAFIFFGSATPSVTINASAANVKLTGGDADDRFGLCVSPAGDFNNDGFSDVIIGAYGDDDGAAGSGCAFVFFGSTTPASTIDTTQANVKLVGADSADRFGYCVGG